MNMISNSCCYFQILLVFALLLQLQVSFQLQTSRSKVELLPGFHGPLPFELETGYVGLGETDDDMQVFYYFIKSENNPENDPLMLWLTGGPGCSSFSGLVYQIGNEKGLQPWINLQGYLLGNPLTTRREKNDQIPFAHGMALISDELYASLQRNCKGEYVNIDSKNELCLRDIHSFDECLSGINLFNILDRYCKDDSRMQHEALWRRSLTQKLKASLSSHLKVPEINCQIYGFFLGTQWANDERVRKALHIREGTIGKWRRCYTTDFEFDISSSFEFHVNLSAKGYRSLIYSGDHDAVAPFMSTQAWIRALNYSIVDDWRPWLVNGQVAGYTRTYSNRMTFATVKGSGHTAPEYKPEEGFAMFTRWISNVPL